MKEFRISVLIAIWALLLSGCQRKELLQPGHHYGNIVNMSVSLAEQAGTEMNMDCRTFTVIAFPQNPSAPVETAQINGRTGSFYLVPAVYDLLIYTSDFFDLDANYYRGMDNMYTAEAYTRQVLKSKDQTKSEFVMENPDPLYALLYKDFEVLPVDGNEIDVQLEQRSYKYWFTIEVQGLEYISSAYLEVYGMYTSAFLWNGANRDEEYGVQNVEAVLLKDENKVYGEFWSFGPHQSAEVKNTMVLNLVNGRHIRVELGDITDLVKPLTYGGEIEIKQKFVVNPGDSGSGFEPEVGEWEDVDVDIPI